jgi:diguanylate cyclase (GGDEF)-like protein
VTKAARLLGVHPNTIRAWSDQGRLQYYRINERGDRRYRLADLQRFLAAAERRPADVRGHRTAGVVTGRRRDTGPARAATLRRQVRGAPPVRPATIPQPPAPAAGANGAMIPAIARLARVAGEARDLHPVLIAAVEMLVDTGGHAFAAALESRDGRFVVRATAGRGADRIGPIREPATLLGDALAASAPVACREPAEPDGLPTGLGTRLATSVRNGANPPWGVLVAAAPPPADRCADTATQPDPAQAAFMEAVAGEVGLAVEADDLRREAQRLAWRAEAFRQVARDVSSHLDVERILQRVVEHARTLFGAERAGLFLRGPNGSVARTVTRGISDAYLEAIRHWPDPSLPTRAIAAGRPLFLQGYRDHPLAAGFRDAVVREGFDTICAAPLAEGDGGGAIGALVVYHDRPHSWTADELETLDAFAAQAAAAIRNAQSLAQTATWAAQLQSIQQLGARLSRFTTAAQVGAAIATELRTLIDYHNVRVYRVVDADDLVPVAMKGEVGEYVDETTDVLRIKVGQGITGWVAANKLPQYLPDAATDPRSETVPGTEDDLAESLLLAPMVFEDVVLGVIVLAKLGVDQFRPDDLRLLVIYASLAAQAMANADATERLRLQSAALQRQIQSQRALLRVSEEILGTLDARRVLHEVTENLSEVVRWDNISIELWDTETGNLRPLVARGAHADQYLEHWLPGEEGLAHWVVRTGEPQLVPDQLADPRIHQFESTGPTEGSLIMVPLRGRDGVTGVLTVERLGTEDRFDEDDFDLVQLFAAQVSIALQNAEAHRAVEIRAETDALTGLLHKGTFAQCLARAVTDGGRFGLLMLDLDTFKTVNDMAGHQAGDEILRAVATTLRSVSREGDRVFRYGGDEFAVLLPNSDTPGAIAAAARIRAGLHRIPVPARIRTRWRVAASIGIATYPADGTRADEILLAADRACFVAKREGRDRIATAAEGLALAAEFTLTSPTPVDPLIEAGDTVGDD